MFDLTILDYIYFAVIIGSTVWATVRGGVYETVATLAWVAAAVVARFVSPWLDGLLQSWFGLDGQTVVTLVASYFIVFFVILLLTGLVNTKLRDRIQRSVLNVTDKTLGVIFGIIRGIIVMGIAYWVILWYYSDTPITPSWVESARTRPVMQMTAVKLDDWFVPGDSSKLLKRDVASTQEAIKIYNNLINPAVQSESEKSDKESDDTGYKNSERTALENQLLQIENVAAVVEQIEENKQGESNQEPNNK